MKVKNLLLSATMLCTGFTAVAADWKIVDMAPNPNDVVTDVTVFEKVHINFGENWKFTVADGASASLVNTETSESVSATKIEFWDFAYNLSGECYLDMSFPAPEANGTYEMIIEANSLICDGEGNAQIMFQYTVNDRSLNQEEIPELEVLSVDPVAGTALPTIGIKDDEVSGRAYTFDTNINKYVVYATAEWRDVTNPMAPEWLTMGEANHEYGDESPVVFYKRDDIKMYEGHTYEMSVVFYDSYAQPRTELGTYKVEYTGTSEAYVHAAQKAIAISPDPSAYVIDDPEKARFTMIFDGAVEIDMEYSFLSLGPLGTEGYSSVTSNEEKTEWTFEIPSSRFEDPSIICSVVARDSEGRTVRGDEYMSQFESGKDDTAGFMFSYQCDMSGVILDVTPAEGVVESLKSFTVYAPEGYVDMMPTWYAKPYVVMGQETVYTFNLEGDTDTSTPGIAVLTMPEELTAPGMYALVIPSSTFNCFDEFDMTVANKQMVISYTIEGEPEANVAYDIELQAIDPAEGEVKELKDFTLTFSGVENCMLYDAYLLDEEGNEVVKGVVDFDWDDFDTYYVSLKETVNEPGNYTLYIPQGTFGDREYCESNCYSGHASKEIRVAYTITMTGVEGIEAETLAGDVYNAAGVLVLRNATSADVKALAKGLYIVGGKKVIVK